MPQALPQGWRGKGHGRHENRPRVVPEEHGWKATVSSPESQAWEALKGAFAGLLRDQRTGRPIEELVLYLADLTTQHGRALAQALHAAKLLPDPAVLLNPERQRMCVGVMTA